MSLFKVTVKWVEPGEDGCPTQREESYDYAVSVARLTAALRGYEYSSEAEALQDFLSANSATLCLEREVVILKNRVLDLTGEKGD